MKSRVYIETSVASFYHEVGTEPDMIARREWTRKFWDIAGEDYTLLTSVAVLEELERGEFPTKLAALDLVSALPLLPNTEEIDLIVDAIFDEWLCPPTLAEMPDTWLLHPFTNAISF
jgi:hypothetical protein